MLLCGGDIRVGRNDLYQRVRPDVASFERLYNSFIRTRGVEPELNGHLINEPSVLRRSFLKKILPLAKDNPKVALTADRLKVGDTLVATVKNTGAEALDLLVSTGMALSAI